MPPPRVAKRTSLLCIAAAACCCRTSRWLTSSPGPPLVALTAPPPCLRSAFAPPSHGGVEGTRTAGQSAVAPRHAAPRGPRLDVLLLERGLAASRQRAVELVAAGSVLVDGVPARKPGHRVAPGCNISLEGGDYHWVGRGALKLLHALEAFPAVDPAEAVCADLGSSTGGFTEVLLHRGAARVFAVDVGHGQLASRLRADERVTVMEGVNARHLTSLPETPDLIVADLSFISVSKVLPVIHQLLPTGGAAVVLVKPQFEVGPGGVGGGGLVRDDQARESAINAVSDAARMDGFEVLGGVDCSIAGAKAGNLEHFLHLRRP